ncbi:UbiD family decarboxylase [Streptomyces celluloflavus]
MSSTHDLRSYLKRLEEIGEVAVIDREVDWHLEIGAITRRTYETRAAAPLFTNIKDFPSGFRVLGAPAGLSAIAGQRLARTALALGLPADADERAVVDLLAQLQRRPGIPPVVVDRTPAYDENVLLGDAVDLLKLPTPHIHPGDGGRYIGTYGTIVSRTPDGEWVNWNIARVMLHDRNTMSGIVSPSQHIGKLFAKWREVGEDMPFALVIGTDPAVPYFSGTPQDDRVNEVELIGSLYGEPVELSCCLTNDLLVPASAELVLEGRLLLDDKTEEGPMGEYQGLLFPRSRSMKPVYRVDAMRHRDDAILPMCAAGYPAEENHVVWGLGMAANIRKHLLDADLPVKDVFLPYEAALHWLVVSVDMDRHWPHVEKEPWSALARRIAETALSCRGGKTPGKVIVVDDRVDVTDPHMVMWALATGNHPGHNADQLITDSLASPLCAYLYPEEAAQHRATKAVYNCLPHDDLPRDSVPVLSDFGMFPAVLRERVLAHWDSDRA